MPYLKVTKRNAEIWPELREGRGAGFILSKDIPVLEDEILNWGEPIILPKEEQPFFVLRDNAKNNYSHYPENSSGMIRAAYLKHATMNAIKLIGKRFEGTDQSILFAGHQISCISLLKLLLQKDSKGIVVFKNTGIWMIEQQDDRSYQLKMYNGEGYSEK